MAVFATAASLLAWPARLATSSSRATASAGSCSSSLEEGGGGGGQVHGQVRHQCRSRRCVCTGSCVYYRQFSMYYV